jgi:hypothetical protein
MPGQPPVLTLPVAYLDVSCRSLCSPRRVAIGATVAVIISFEILIVSSLTLMAVEFVAE